MLDPRKVESDHGGLMSYGVPATRFLRLSCCLLGSSWIPVTPSVRCVALNPRIPAI